MKYLAKGEHHDEHGKSVVGIISVSDLGWQEQESGLTVKNLWTDPETTRRAVMARIAPGAHLPRHRHVGDELVFVIEGAISDEFGTVSSGNMGYRSNGCVHTVSSTNGADDRAPGDLGALRARRHAGPSSPCG